MDTAFKRALSRVRASESLKERTADFILQSDANIIPIRAAKSAAGRSLFVKRFAAVACAVLLLCALPVGAYAYYRTPTSYISVDINPSVELGVNAFGKVVSVIAYNEDGETVIGALSLLNMDVESAVEQIVASAAENGFLQDDGSSFVSITVETNSDTTADDIGEDAVAGANNALASGNNTATVEASQIGLDRRDEAIEFGISPGKLNLIEKLQQLDPEVSLEEYVSQYQDASVKDIQKKYIALKNGEKEQIQLQDQDQLQLQQQDQDQIQQQDQLHKQDQDPDKQQEKEQNQSQAQNQGQNDAQESEQNKEQNENSEKNGHTNNGANASALPSAEPSDDDSSGNSGSNGNNSDNGNSGKDSDEAAASSSSAHGNSGNSNAGGKKS